MNIFVNQLNSYVTEVNRVAVEVGSEGKLGGQVVVKGAEGAWMEMIDNVNTMTANFTHQVSSLLVFSSFMLLNIFTTLSSPIFSLLFVSHLPTVAFIFKLDSRNCRGNNSCSLG